jgi:hypothetical protein
MTRCPEMKSSRNNTVGRHRHSERVDNYPSLGESLTGAAIDDKFAGMPIVIAGLQNKGWQAPPQQGGPARSGFAARWSAGFTGVGRGKIPGNLLPLAGNFSCWQPTITNMRALAPISEGFVQT